MRKLLLKLFFLSFFPSFIFAQINRDSVSFILDNYKYKSLNSAFTKQLNTTNLNSGLRYNFNNNNFFIGINERYLSTVFKSTSKNIRDEQYLSFLGEYNLSPFLKIGLHTTNNIFSDNRKIAINEASILHSSVYFKIIPLSKIRFISFGGFSINRQISENDKGFLYGLETVMDRRKFSDFSIESFLKFQNEDISPRKNTLRLFDITVSNSFQNDFNNSISAKFYETRRDFYFNADSLLQREFNITNNIQSRIAKNYLIEDRVFFSSMKSDFTFGLIGKIFRRDINRNTRYIPTANITASTFDSKIEEFKLNLSGMLGYNTRLLNTLFKFEYSERTEKHSANRINGANEIFYEERQVSEFRKNNQSQLAILSGALSYKISHKDRLSLSILHRKLAYDTPSENNYDDRDELLTIFRILYSRKFSSIFNFFINLEGSFNHIVYIFAQRSSNNNIRRVLKLSTGGNFTAKYLISKNSAEVSANYTVYDFEDIIPNVKSYSFRQFAFRDSTNLEVMRNIYLSLNGYVKFSEQGNFKWTNFTNKPERFLAEYFAIPKLSFQHSNLTMSIGIRLFTLTTYKYNKNNVKFKDSNYRSLGPLAELKYFMGSGLLITMNGWYEFIKSELNVRKEIANLSLYLNWNI
ncbi:hypothetical protein BMS3Abin04_02490 [bacterium BMS3Abin04]|nr:hypothetical protein BMS3Abin04_02490 [bacterium BMS3Abin04]